MYFNGYLIVLVLFLVDSIKSGTKYKLQCHLPVGNDMDKLSSMSSGDINLVSAVISVTQRSRHVSDV